MTTYIRIICEKNTICLPVDILLNNNRETFLLLLWLWLVSTGGVEEKGKEVFASTVRELFIT